VRTGAHGGRDADEGYTMAAATDRVLTGRRMFDPVGHHVRPDVLALGPPRGS
jgi:hypothetical protein